MPPWQQFIRSSGTFVADTSTKFPAPSLSQTLTLAFDPQRAMSMCASLLRWANTAPRLASLRSGKVRYVLKRKCPIGTRL